MSDAVVHLGAGMLETPELLLRQVLIEGIVELAGDDERLDELFARFDTLLQGSQEEWVADLKAAFLRMAELHAEGGIRVGVGYPLNEAVYPYVSIVTESASEQPGGASMGDVLGRTYTQTGTPSATDPTSSQSTRHTVIGVDYVTNVQVGCWSLAPEESILLNSVVRHLLFRHKGRIVGAGARDVTMSESGFEPNPGMYPRTGWVPVIRCTLDWTLRQTRRTRPVPTRITATSTTFYN